MQVQINSDTHTLISESILIQTEESDVTELVLGYATGVADLMFLVILVLHGKQAINLCSASNQSV
jgi:hypothetical protein